MELDRCDPEVGEVEGTGPSERFEERIAGEAKLKSGRWKRRPEPEATCLGFDPGSRLGLSKVPKHRVQVMFPLFRSRSQPWKRLNGFCSRELSRYTRHEWRLGN